MTNTRSTRSSAQGSPQKQQEDVGGSAQQPPPFLTKTYDMVSDPKRQDVVSWSPDGKSFTVWNLPEFSKEVLPLYFKHNNFSSFVRQLNTYGFRKSDPDQWQFSNERFIRGRRDLLKDIHRRKTVPGSARDMASNVPGNAVIEVGSFGGVMDEVAGLKRDKNVLMMELVRLRQHQQASEQEIRAMQQRLEATEMRQHHMMSFLAKAMNNPAFLQHFLSARNTSSRLTDSKGRKKRRAARTASDADSLPQEVAADPMNALVSYQPHDDQFSSQFLHMLAREGQPHLHTNGILSNGGAHFEVEGLSDNSSGSPPRPDNAAWSPPDVSDMGTAFDSLNLATVPSTVTIEPLPVPSTNGLQDMLAVPQTMPQSSGFPGPLHANFSSGGAFTRSNVAASDFGMPEILPSTSMSPSDILLNGAGPSERGFGHSFAGAEAGPNGAQHSSPFSATLMQNGGGNASGAAAPPLTSPLDLPRMSMDMALPGEGTPSDMFGMDGPDAPGQDAFWQQLFSASSNLGPGDMWDPQTPPVSGHGAAAASAGIPPITAADVPIPVAEQG